MGLLAEVMVELLTTRQETQAIQILAVKEMLHLYRKAGLIKQRQLSA
jgi:hypothetical protein